MICIKVKEYNTSNELLRTKIHEFKTDKESIKFLENIRKTKMINAYANHTNTDGSGYRESKILKNANAIATHNYNGHKYVQTKPMYFDLMREVTVKYDIEITHK